MESLLPFGQKRMTVKEVSEALGVEERTIQRHIKAIRANSDNVVAVDHGTATYMNEVEVTEIKRRVERSGRNDLDNVVQVQNATTELEMAQKTVEVINWYMIKLEAATTELAIARPKAEAHDALMCSEKTMSITDAAKHFGLHPKLEVFPYLRIKGYLTLNDLPTQAAIDAGYLALRQTKAQDGRIWPQAVVEVWQLETWRSRVVHQIKHWRQGASA